MPAGIIEISRHAAAAGKWREGTTDRAPRTARGDCMYFIASGEVEVEVKPPGAARGRALSSASMALLGTARKATVHCRADTLLILDLPISVFTARNPRLAGDRSEAKTRGPRKLQPPTADVRNTTSDEDAGERLASSSEFSIRFWGVRGSIACPGPATERYGGNTPCVEVRCGDRLIILDAGTGMRELGNALGQDGSADRRRHPAHALPLRPCRSASRSSRRSISREHRFRLWAGNLLPEFRLKP